MNAKSQGVLTDGFSGNADFCMSKWKLVIQSVPPKRVPLDLDSISSRSVHLCCTIYVLWHFFTFSPNVHHLQSGYYICAYCQYHISIHHQVGSGWREVLVSFTSIKKLLKICRCKVSFQLTNSDSCKTLHYITFSLLSFRAATNNKFQCVRSFEPSKLNLTIIYQLTATVLILST